MHNNKYIIYISLWRAKQHSTDLQNGPEIICLCACTKIIRIFCCFWCWQLCGTDILPGRESFIEWAKFCHCNTAAHWNEVGQNSTYECKHTFLQYPTACFVPFAPVANENEPPLVSMHLQYSTCIFYWFHSQAILFLIHEVCTALNVLKWWMTSETPTHTVGCLHAQIERLSSPPILDPSPNR